MTGGPSSPLLVRWQAIGVTVAIAATLVGPAIYITREMNTVEERIQFLTARIDKIEAHNADTARRFEEQSKINGAEEAKFQALELKMCLKHSEFCK